MVNAYAEKRGTARSSIRELFAYGKQRIQEVGVDGICDFSLGNPATPPPQEVQTTLERILAEENPMAVHGYTAAEGAYETRDAIAKSVERRFGMHVTAGDFFMTAGAAPALTAVFAALTIDEETNFIALAPYFPEYQVFSHVWGASLKVVEPTYPDFQIDFASLENAIDQHTQGVVVNSPNNPSGVVYTKKTLEGLAEILTRKSQEYGHPIYIICDEPYRELAYDKEVPYIPGIYGNTIVCYSYSKTLSLPGDRIGYVMVSPTAMENEKVMHAIAGAARCIGHVCAPSTYQALVRECVDVKPDLAFYDRNRRLLYENLTQMGYECAYPDGAFYLMVKAPIGDGDTFSQMAKEKDLLVVPCSSFGCPGYVRVAYCVAEDVIHRALPIFRELIQKA